MNYLLPVFRDWLWLQRTQWMRPKDLSEIRSKKLHKALEHAYRDVPFYRRLYDQANVDIDKISSTEDVNRLPILKRAQLRAVPLNERTAKNVDVSSCLRWQSSGTSGVRLETLNDPQFLAIQDALMLRVLWAYGIRPFDKVCRVIARSLPGLHEKIGILAGIADRVYAHLMLEDDPKEQLIFLEKWKPKVVIGLPSLFRALISQAHRIGHIPNFPIAASLGEMLDDSTRKGIKETFGADVFDLYGTEEGGFMFWECPSHSGYHMNIDSAVIEFLRDSPDDGRVGFGEPGHVCVTAFDRVATPLIRAWIGDLATPIENPCDCGRGLPLLGEVHGKSIDYISTKDGHMISPYLVLRQIRQVSGLEAFKLLQQGDYSIQIHVQTKSQPKEKILQEAQARCAPLFGEIPISVEVVDAIPDSGTYKFRLIESKVTSQAN